MLPTINKYIVGVSALNSKSFQQIQISDIAANISVINFYCFHGQHSYIDQGVEESYGIRPITPTTFTIHCTKPDVCTIDPNIRNFIYFFLNLFKKFKL